MRKLLSQRTPCPVPQVSWTRWWLPGKDPWGLPGIDLDRAGCQTQALKNTRTVAGWWASCVLICEPPGFVFRSLFTFTQAWGGGGGGGSPCCRTEAGAAADRGRALLLPGTCQPRYQTLVLLRRLRERIPGVVKWLCLWYSVLLASCGSDAD